VKERIPDTAKMVDDWSVKEDLQKAAPQSAAWQGCPMLSEAGKIKEVPSLNRSYTDRDARTAAGFGMWKSMKVLRTGHSAVL